MSETTYYAENETQAEQMKKQWEMYGKQDTCVILLNGKPYYKITKRVIHEEVVHQDDSVETVL